MKSTNLSALSTIRSTMIPRRVGGVWYGGVGDLDFARQNGCIFAHQPTATTAEKKKRAEKWYIATKAPIEGRGGAGRRRGQRRNHGVSEFVSAVACS